MNYNTVIHIHLPPKQAPNANVHTRGFNDKHTSEDSAIFTITGICSINTLVHYTLTVIVLTIACVKGILSINDEAIADTHNIITMATSI